MTSLIRTTITIPEDLLKEAKLQSIQEDKNLSLLIREALTEKLYEVPQKKKALDRISKLGKYKLGSVSNFSRKEIYARYLGKKISS